MDRTARALIEAAKDVLAELDLDSVLQRVLLSARELTGARYAALGVLDEQRRELAQFITVGLDEATRREIGDLPRGRGVLGELIQHPAPLRLANVADHPRSYGFPPGHPPMGSFLGVPIIVGETPWGNLYLTDKAGGEFTEEDEEAAVVFADLAAIAIENARRFTGSEYRRDELEHTVGALQASTEISRALAGETDLRTVLDLVAKRGRALVSARSLMIELRDGDEFVVAAAAGEFPLDLVGERLPMEQTVAGHVLRSGESQRLTDELKRTRFAKHGWGSHGVDPEAGLFVPLSFRGQTLGVLAVFDRLADGPEFADGDRELLEAFATSAASAVATARSLQAERGRQRLAAAEEERRRWARELHDETLQGLAALKLALAGATRSGDPAAVTEAVGLATKQLEQEIASLRALINDLRPASLDELGIEAAIATLAERASQEGPRVDVAMDLAADRLTPELETALYRVTQEALTNIRKHADAERVLVEVEEDAQSIRLTVRDDGRGFDLSQPTSGFGLAGMRERVELLEGELRISSAPGEGTTVIASLPARHRSATAA